MGKGGMIVYDAKRLHGFPLLWNMKGSPLVDVLPYSLTAAFIAIFIKCDGGYNWGIFPELAEDKSREDSLFDHPYSLHIWGTVLGFFLVFRSNQAYGRFWEGRRELARMGSYWGDVAGHCVTFDEINTDVDRYYEWKEQAVHLCSLMHALAIQCLRSDDDLDNLVPFIKWSDASNKNKDGSGFFYGSTSKQEQPILNSRAAKHRDKSPARASPLTRLKMSQSKTAPDLAAIAALDTSAAPEPELRTPKAAKVDAKAPEGDGLFISFSEPDGPHSDPHLKPKNPPASKKIADAALQRTKSAPVQKSKKRLGTLQLHVLEAKDLNSLHHVDAIRGSDICAFCKLKLDGALHADETHSTKVVKGDGSCPKFKSKFELEVYEDDENAVIDMFHSQRRGGDVSLGSVHIHLEEVLEKKSLFGWWDVALSTRQPAGQGRRSTMNTNGQLQLSLKFVAVNRRTRDHAYRVDTSLNRTAQKAADNPLGVVGGVTEAERRALEACGSLHGERVYLCSVWLQRTMCERSAKGGLKAPPPVLATGTYRNLATGNDAFAQCKKIVDTPFPFPYAQAVLFAVCLFTIMAPFQLCEIINSNFMAPVISFIAVALYASLNEVAKELEDPFGHDVHQLPIKEIHLDFNEKMWLLSQRTFWRTEWPDKKSSAKDEKKMCLEIDPIADKAKGKWKRASNLFKMASILSPKNKAALKRSTNIIAVSRAFSRTNIAPGPLQGALQKMVAGGTKGGGDAPMSPLEKMVKQLAKDSPVVEENPVPDTLESKAPEVKAQP